MNRELAAAYRHPVQVLPHLGSDFRSWSRRSQWPLYASKLRAMGNHVVYVDVDDTLVRSAGNKRLPIPSSVAKVRALHSSRAILYLWSTGGADYARATAKELGIVDCFAGFLPKPTVIIDDQHIAEWRDLRHLLPTDDVTL